MRSGASLVVMQGEWAGVPVGPDVWETCRELIPERSVFAFLAEHREVLFPAGMFADMYPSPNGRPSYPPQVLSTVVVLQVLNGLSDAEAVQELRCDLRWKAACGLGLLDGGFDSSLLTYFRRRLQHSRDPHRVFTAVCQVIEATGILRGRHRRALDSTVFQDAVATQDTVTQLISAIRRVAREVPGGTETVKDRCTGHDYLAGPGKPKIAWDDEKARAELADALVTDALQVLAHLPEQNLGEKAANAVGILALVAGQDVEPLRIPTAATAAGALPGAPPPAASSPPLTLRRGTSTRPPTSGPTASKAISPSSRKPGCSLRSPYVRAAAPTTPRELSRWTCWPMRPGRLMSSGTPPTPATTTGPP